MNWNWVRLFVSNTWLSQKPGTTHCGPVAIYNVLRAMGKWVPFRLLKLMCFTNVWIHGTQWNFLVGVFKFFIPHSNSIHHVNYEFVQSKLANGIPLLMTYPPDTERNHAVAIIQHENIVTIINEDHWCNQYTWEQFKERFEKIEAISKQTGQQISVIYPLDKAKYVPYKKAS